MATGRLCTKCKIRPQRSGKSTDCNTCHATKYREARNRAKARRRQELRTEVLLAYGGKCVECGEADTEVLVLDHVNDDGHEHRKTVGNPQVFLDLKRRGYPPVVQVLCANDNMRKERKRLGLVLGSSGA